MVTELYTNTYTEIAPGSIVQMNLANGYGDFNDYCAIVVDVFCEEIESIGEYVLPIRVSCDE